MTLLRRNYLSLLTIWAAMAMGGVSVAQAEPMQLAIQGRLTSAGGGPVADGNYALAIGFYTQAVGGNPVFEEDFLAVSVTGGGFAETLGAAKDPLDTTIFAAGQPLWVSVTVGKDELSRVPLSRTPYAAQASMAKIAADLQCSGCVGTGDIAPEVLAPYALKAELAPIAATGQYADLKGIPKLADVASSGVWGDLLDKPTLAKLGTACGSGLWVRGLKADGSLDCAAIGDFLPLTGGTIAGKLQIDGTLALGKSAIQGGRFDAVDIAATLCDASVQGQVVLNTANQKLYFCDGKAWQRLATCTSVCPDAALVTCGQTLIDNCGDPCKGTGSFCAGTATCTSGKCVASVGTKDNPAASCLALKNALPASASGLYWLDPDGGDAANAFQTWCEMSLDGGGWTLLTIVGSDARPTVFSGGTYPRPGATFYGTASSSLGDILVAAKNNSGVKNFSVQGKFLFANSATREVMAWVGGDGDDYLKVSLPATCNPFDPAVSCAENVALGLKLVDSAGKVITSNGQMCSTIGDSCGLNEAGFHLLDGADNNSCSCHATAAGTGFQSNGRMWTTFNRSDGGYWDSGVHGSWKASTNQPGALLIR